MARYFNGGRIVVPDHADWDAATWSLVSWVNIQSRAGTLQTYFSRDDNASQRHFQIRGNGGEIQFLLWPAGTSLLTSGLDTYDRQWHHIACVYDGNNKLIYVDGILKASAVHGAQSTVNVQFDIGQRGFGTTAPMFGYLWDAAFYGRVLAPWEIKAIADLKLQNQGPDLLAHWMLEGTSSTELDISGRGHHGTINDFNIMSTVLSTPRFKLDQRNPIHAQLILSDSATIYLDIQTSGTEVGPYTDAGEVYVNIQASGVDEYIGSQIYLDSATIPVDIQVSGIDIKEISDAATVYVDLQSSGVDIYSPPCLIIGEGEAELRWFASDVGSRWSEESELRWQAILTQGTAQC